jgi:lipid-binding SYLF domain-containing protein
MSNKNLFCRLNLILLIFALSLPVTFAAAPSGDKARQQARADIPDDAKEQYERSQDAAEILGELTRTPEKGIPRELLDDAQGIAVFPHVVKAAFGIGGRWGKGLLSVRQGSGWGAPVYVDLSGGSFGFQIGGQSTDLVLVFKSRKGVESLMSSKLKLGADASIAAGPVGRTAEAGTDVKLNAEIYSYSRAKGAFAGVALDGAVVDFDDSANRKVYGMEGKQVLSGTASASPVTAPFLAALRQHSPATRPTQ